MDGETQNFGPSFEAQLRAAKPGDVILVPRGRRMKVDPQRLDWTVEKFARAVGAVIDATLVDRAERDRFEHDL